MGWQQNPLSPELRSEIAEFVGAAPSNCDTLPQDVLDYCEWVWGDPRGVWSTVMKWRMLNECSDCGFVWEGGTRRLNIYQYMSRKKINVDLRTDSPSLQVLMDNAIECCIEYESGESVVGLVVQETFDAVKAGQVKHLYLIGFIKHKDALSDEEYAAEVGRQSERLCLQGMRRLAKRLVYS
jgi:hypothetical protein